jgi:hypothetical protein
MTRQEALLFIREHGIVLESARGRVPTFAEAVAGARISGSWWAHPKGREIFALTRTVRASREILVCRIIDGKITYVHRRLWPALVRLSGELDRDRLGAIHEIHTRAGKHVAQVRPFPEWVPRRVAAEAKGLTVEAARRAVVSRGLVVNDVVGG